MEQSYCADALEEAIVRHCAPTLAGCKPANMFMLHHDTCVKDHGCQCSFDDALASVNFKLAEIGVCAIRLARTRRANTLIFVCRPTLLLRVLKHTPTASYLRRPGYDPRSLSSCLSDLKVRVCTCILGDARGVSFPHEIGFFLGYPYDDVAAFIAYGGANATCTGCWRVYSNVVEAQRCFCRYRLCTKLYRQLYDQGIPLERLPKLAA